MYYYILSRNDIIKFTYEDYLKVVKQKEKRKHNILHEESESYAIINEKDINNEHDKTYRKLLDNKKDVAYIINEALNLKEIKVKPEELEKYNSSFITNQFKNREADIVYKLKQRNIFFLIEHQSKTDYAMPYRIEEYKYEIMKSAVDPEKLKTKGYEMPEVIPIVIYTGKTKWKVREYLHQVEDERFKKVNLLKYNLIDINQYSKERLLNSNNFIDKIFLIEKTKNAEELVEILKTIILQLKDEEDKRNLVGIMTMILKGKLGEETVNKLVKQVQKEEKNMLAVERMLIEESKRIRKEGIKEGIQEGMRQGLEYNIPINVDTIKEGYPILCA